MVWLLNSTTQLTDPSYVHLPGRNRSELLMVRDIKRTNKKFFKYNGGRTPARETGGHTW